MFNIIGFLTGTNLINRINKTNPNFRGMLIFMNYLNSGFIY